ncbi:MAG TPA: ATP-binding cassette domain-containing protein [Candidatus Sulfotelmatobacter sp.]|nr:ATP-binding cassette domain-containing protein [Candidatus Sulfotelmatobacter sp.]
MRSVSDTPAGAAIAVRNLDVGYGSFVVQRDLRFDVPRGKVFIIMGGSGCGKSTVLRVMIGLLPPLRGEVLVGGVSLWQAEERDREAITRQVGVLYQGGALWSGMTLAENVELPLAEFTDIGAGQRREMVALKLALVGLAGFEDFYPAQLSGGMQKRAALARAMALDPDILFLDEPTAGLDPVSSRRFDDLILELRESLGCTVVVVTHELASIFTIGDDAIFLDAERHTVIAHGNPKVLLAESTDPTVRAFLTRGEPATAQAQGSASPPSSARSQGEGG